MSHLIMYAEYRHLDKKSRALVSRHGAKCDDEAFRTLTHIIGCNETLEKYELDDGPLSLLDKDYRKCRANYRKFNRLFRKLYRRCHSKK